jgi:phosphinothricin acetyltransferase
MDETFDETFVVRDARPDDAEALAAIYRPFVERTVVSFELAVPDAVEFAARIAAVQLSHSWLVAAAAGRTIGYAYGCKHRERAAYRWTAEVSAYVESGWQRRGVARALYERLFDGLALRGYCNALAGIALPNDASVAFHRRMGFTDVGVYHRIGHKFGRWHDVAWLERRLRDEPPA